MNELWSHNSLDFNLILNINIFEKAKCCLKHLLQLPGEGLTRACRTMSSTLLNVLLSNVISNRLCIASQSGFGAAVLFV